MFTRILQTFIWFCMLIVFGLAFFLSSQTYGNYKAVVFIIVLVIGFATFAVIGTFMEMSLTLISIDKNIKKLVSQDTTYSKEILDNKINMVENKINDIKENKDSKLDFSKEDTKKCTSCEANVPLVSKFCPKCGNSI